MAETATFPNRGKLPWTLTLFCLLAVAGLVAMPFVAGEPTQGALPDAVRFIGRFHPVVLHLPIGVFALILLQELSAVFGRRSRPSAPASLFPLFFGAASAIVATVAGFLLYHGEAADYAGNELAERHLWAGLAFSVVAVLTLMAKVWTLALSANPAWFRLPLFVSVGIMGFASHDGASITHGSDYLTQYAPAPIRKLIGLDPVNPAPADKPTADQVVYADLIAPIFERRCVQCHKEGKAKGKLRMDTYEMLVIGGKEGPAIVPGDADGSNIVFRIELPEDDDEHMPPEGKAQIEAAELAVIKWWIDQGADPSKKLADFDLPAVIEQSIPLLASTRPDPKPALAQPIEAAAPDDTLKSLVD